MAEMIGTVHDLTLRDGRTLRIHDAGPSAATRPTVLWHHGSPQSGALLPPLADAAASAGLRLVSYARPGYGGSTAAPGRDVAGAADDVAQLADALGIERFAVMGASGGGPHALACAALLPDRVTAVACLAAIAPPTGREDWYAGMADPGGLRAAVTGRDARARYAQTAEFDPASFTDADWAALAGAWAALGDDASHAGEAWPGGLVDDDVAFARGWGFSLGQVEVPALLVQGGQDRVVPPAHVDLLAAALPDVEVWRRPDDGHISVLHACADAMGWLLARDVPAVTPRS